MGREEERDMTRPRKNPPLIERGEYLISGPFVQVTIRLSPYTAVAENGKHCISRASLRFGAAFCVC